MGYWINEPILQEPDRIDRDIAALAEAGYGVVRIFLRKTNYNHRSPKVVSAVARIVKAAHARGLRAALDCEPRGGGFCHDLGQSYPDAVGAGRSAGRLDVRGRGGRVPVPRRRGRAPRTRLPNRS
jgi:hypothetical protein